MKERELHPDKTATLTAPTTCGGSFDVTRDVQRIASPGYPASYAPGLNCEWVFTAPRGEHISMRFVQNRLASYIQSDTLCKKDSVLIYDGKLSRKTHSLQHSPFEAFKAILEKTGTVGFPIGFARLFAILRLKRSF